MEELAAGVFGVALLVALFLPWYRSDVTGAKYTAWQAFGSLDVVLAVVGLIAVTLAVVAALHPTAAVPVATASLLALVGVPATALAISRIVSHPHFTPPVQTLSGAPAPHVAHGSSLEFGAWIGLGGCVAVTIAALVSMRDERFPRAIAEATQLDVETLPAPPRETGAEGSA